MNANDRPTGNRGYTLIRISDGDKQDPERQRFFEDLVRRDREQEERKTNQLRGFSEWVREFRDYMARKPKKRRNRN